MHAHTHMGKPIDIYILFSVDNGGNQAVASVFVMCAASTLYIFYTAQAFSEVNLDRLEKKVAKPELGLAVSARSGSQLEGGVPIPLSASERLVATCGCTLEVHDATSRRGRTV